MNRIELIQQTLSKIPSSDPFMMVDIGSMGGIEKEWESVQKQIVTVGFEPDPREFAKLKTGPNEIYFNYALHQSDGIPVSIYLSKEPGKSSIFKPNVKLLQEYPSADRFDVVDKVDIAAEKVRSLDSLVKSEGLGRVHFMKLDTQGSELLILKGAHHLLLNSVVGLKVEVEFQELYQEQPLFSQLDQYVRDAGFNLVDIRRVFWRKNIHADFPGKGQLVFGDALYFLSGAALQARLSKLSPAARISQVLGFATVALIYGVHDLACEVLREAAKVDPENRSLFEAVSQSIFQHDRSRQMPRIWGAEKIFRLIDRVGKRFGHRRHAFAEADLDLGNQRIG